MKPAVSFFCFPFLIQILVIASCKPGQVPSASNPNQCEYCPPGTAADVNQQCATCPAGSGGNLYAQLY